MQTKWVKEMQTSLMSFDAFTLHRRTIHRRSDKDGGHAIKRCKVHDGAPSDNKANWQKTRRLVSVGLDHVLLSSLS
jgi:hypothetical protein